MIEWAQWNQKHGIRLSTDKQIITYPFEEAEYILRQVNKFGRSKPQAKKMWDQRVRQTWKRDNHGEEGALRLWLAKKEQEVQHDETFQEGAAVEGSKMIKAPKANQMDALRMHVHECGLSHGHEFFANQSTLEQQILEQGIEKSTSGSGSSGINSQGVKRASATNSEGVGTPIKKAKGEPDDLDPEGADDGMGEVAIDCDEGDETTPAKKKRGPTLNSKRTNLFQSSSDGLRDLVLEVRDQITVCLTALTQNEQDTQPSNAAHRKARESYVKGVQDHLGVAQVWIGDLPLDANGAVTVVKSDESAKASDGAAEVAVERKEDNVMSRLRLRQKKPEVQAPASEVEAEAGEKKLEAEAASAPAAEAEAKAEEKKSEAEAPAAQVMVEAEEEDAGDGEESGTAAPASGAGSATEGDSVASQKPAVACPVKLEPPLEQGKHDQDPWKLWRSKIKKDEVNMSVLYFFFSCRNMETYVDAMRQVATEAEYEKKKLAWGRMSRSVVELVSGMKDSAKELTKHMSLLQAAVERGQKADQLKRDKEALAKQSVDLKERAKLLQAQKETVDILPVFSCKGQDFKQITSFIVADKDGTLAQKDTDMDIPFIVTTSPALTQWFGDKTMQQTMTTFGAKYKKQKTFEKERKYSTILTTKQGKEITAELFQKKFKAFQERVVDISSVSSSWMDTFWMYGLDPAWSNVGLQPNSAASIRIKWLGSLEVFCAPVEGLKKAFNENGTVIHNFTQLKEAFGGLTDLTYTAMRATCHDFYVHRCVLPKEQLLYIPAGWMVAERVTGGPLQYGVRKSMFFCSKSATSNYGTCKDLLEADKHNVQKMEDVFDILGAASEALDQA